MHLNLIGLVWDTFIEYATLGNSTGYVFMYVGMYVEPTSTSVQSFIRLHEVD